MDPNHVVQLSFESFDVEPDTNCTYDSVVIHDGPDEDSNRLLLHCGTVVPEPNIIRSTGNVMYMRLRADGTRGAQGFKANYTRVSYGWHWKREKV